MFWTFVNIINFYSAGLNDAVVDSYPNCTTMKWTRWTLVISVMTQLRDGIVVHVGWCNGMRTVAFRRSWLIQTI